MVSGAAVAGWPRDVETTNATNQQQWFTAAPQPDGASRCLAGDDACWLWCRGTAGGTERNAEARSVWRPGARSKFEREGSAAGAKAGGIRRYRRKGEACGDFGAR